MYITRRALFKKIIKTAATMVVILTLILGTSTPALASSDLQVGSEDENNPDAQEFLQEIIEYSPTSDVESSAEYQETFMPDEILIDRDRINYFPLTMPQLENREHNIIVYLPSGYQTGNNSYPVIYFLDAQNVFIQSSISPEDRILNESLFQFYARAFDREAIIVGIEYDQIHLWDEYSPWVNTNMYLWMDSYDANQVEGGEGDAYLDFLVETVKPAIDARYKTLTDRENTSIGGSKMGGLLSLYAGLTKPEIYSKVTAMSPDVWFAESGGSWLSNNQLLKFIDQNGVPDNVSFFLDVDLEDRITDLVVRPAVLDSLGVKISFPQTYLEGTQVVVDRMLRNSLSVSSIVGGIDNPTEWTKTMIESSSMLLADANIFLSYVPLIVVPATPPLITSTSSTTFIISIQNSFTITTTGSPIPMITYSGALPAGVSFTDNGNGTAKISGTPTTTGTFTLTITAHNDATPNATQTFTLKVIEGCPDSGSCFLTFSISMSPYISRTRNITVYLPPNYNSGVKYPVIYLMDAQHMFGSPIAHPLDIDDWKIDELLDSHYRSTGKGVIAVGIWFDADYPWSEYTLTPNLNMDHWVSNSPQLTSPEGGAMIAYIRDNVKPAIDSRFHTLTDRNNTAIGGGSRCALLALNAGLHAPLTFSRVMSFSPAVWIAEGGSRVIVPELTTWYSDNGLGNWFTKYQAPTNVKYFLYVGGNEVSTGSAIFDLPYVQKPTAIGDKITLKYAYDSGYVRVKAALETEGVPSANLLAIRYAAGTHYPNVWRAYIIPNVLPFFGY